MSNMEEHTNMRVSWTEDKGLYFDFLNTGDKKRTNILTLFSSTLPADPIDVSASSVCINRGE